MKKILITIIFISFLQSCNSVRESAGVNRKNIDEYQVIENPPLIIPPNFNLISPDQIETKTLEGTESKIAEQILFGLDNNEVNINKNEGLLNEIIEQTSQNDELNDIRNTIDNNFADEKNINDDVDFNNIEEVNSAIEETNTKREKLTGEKSEKKKSKKKRFIFF